MSRFHFSVLAILLMIAVALTIIDKNYKSSLPLINLPIQAHNTIGEIPLISQFDSGGVQNITPRVVYIERPKRRNWGEIMMMSSAVPYSFVSCETIDYR